MEDQQLLIKVISVGDSQSGKLCLIKRFCDGKFINKYATIIGADYSIKKMIFKNKKVTIIFFYLSGDEGYKEIRYPFLLMSGFSCGFTDKSSIQNFISKRMMFDNELDLKKRSRLCCLKKSDLKNKEEDSRDIFAQAKKKRHEGIICSAAGGENGNELFVRMFGKIVGLY